MKNIISIIILTTLITTSVWAGKDRGGGSLDKIYGPATPQEFEIYNIGDITVLPYGQRELSNFMLNFKNFLDYFQVREESDEGVLKLTNFISKRLESNGYEDNNILLANSKEKISIEAGVKLFIEVFRNVYSQLHPRLEYIVTNKGVTQKGLFYFSNSCLDKDKSSDASAIDGEPNSYICLSEKFKNKELSLSKFMGLIFHEYLRQYNVIVNDKDYLIEEHLFASIVNLLWVDTQIGLLDTGKCLLSFKLENPRFPFSKHERFVGHYWQFDPRDPDINLSNGSDVEFRFDGAPFTSTNINSKWVYNSAYSNYKINYRRDRMLECKILRTSTAPESKDRPYGQYNFTRK